MFFLWDNLMKIGEFAAMAVFSIMGGIYIFSKVRKAKEDETNKAEDRLVTLLKTTVDLQGNEIEDLKIDLLATQRNVARIQDENMLMKNILQGRDTKTNEMYEMTKSNTKNLENLYTLLEKHMGIIEQTLQVKK